MSDRLTLELYENSVQEPRTVEVAREPVTSAEQLRAPLFIPSRQLYYWTKEWQDGEATALSDLRLGRSRLFTDRDDLGRYLAGE